MLAKNERTSMSSERTESPAAPDYETKAQVARRLNVSKRTIDNLMKQRRLPFIKLTSKLSASPKPTLTPFSPGISVSELAVRKRVKSTERRGADSLPAPTGHIGL
jgi:DNA-binding XRE family transcriptional regulator